jgi:diguanylate cyclase (GGDEF)-like protein
MLDLDDFKRFNDSFGHPAGDEVLSGLARLLGQTLRAMDTAARYGGEEFAVVLPESSLAEANGVAERLLAAVQERAAAAGWPTISVGTAAAPEHGQTPAELVRAADEALYRAKRAGKNRVCAAR